MRDEPVRILIIDDNRKDREQYRKILKRNSGPQWKFFEADTGAEGLEYCRASSPDCVLLNYELGDLDGLGFLKELETSGGHLPVPVVMLTDDVLTGDGNERIAVEAVKRGAVDCIPKASITAESLRRVMRTALERAGELRKLRAHDAQTAVAHVLARMRTREEAIPAILESVCRTLGWDLCAWWQLDDDGDPRCIATRSARPDGLHGMSTGATFARKVFAGQPLWIAGRGEPGSLGFPIPVSGTVPAIIECRGHDVRQPDEELTTALGLGSQIGQFIELRQAEESLRRSEQELADFFDNAPFCCSWVGPDGVILRANQAERDLLGYTSEQYIGHSIAEFHADPEVALDFLDRLAGGETLTDFEARLIPRDALNQDGSINHGSIKHVLINANVRFESGRFLHTRCETRDITERKRADDELNYTIGELGRSNAALQQFAYAASHDLQEPLRMVSGFTQLLAKRYFDKLDESGVEYVGYVLEGATRMRALIDDLLEYSRVGTRDVQVQPVDMGDVFRQSLANLRTAVEESGADISAGPLPLVTADPVQLAQIFQNLIGNAIKFHGPSAPQVRVSAEPRGDEWIFAVQDNGIGVPHEFRDRIFEVFQRLHGKNEFPGTGIGLAVCKKIVDRHGGRIWVESEPGQGSTFYFTLPATAPARKSGLAPAGKR